MSDTTGTKESPYTDADALQGPILDLQETRTITHPEHGDIVCPAGIYEITYQRAYADELRRVRD